MRRKGSKHKTKNRDNANTLDSIRNILIKTNNAKASLSLNTVNTRLKEAEATIARVIAKHNNIVFKQEVWDNRNYIEHPLDAAFEELLFLAYNELIKDRNDDI